MRFRVPSLSVATVCLSMKFYVAPLSRRARVLAILCHMYVLIEMVIESYVILYMVAIARLEAFTTQHCENPPSCRTHRDMCSAHCHPFLLQVWQFVELR